MKPSSEILSGFPAVSFSEWEKAIARELKGGDYQTALQWDTGNGFSVLPFYTGYQPLANDLATGRRGSKTGSNEWEVNRVVRVKEINTANKKALKALNEGATSLTFVNRMEKIGYADFVALLKEIEIAYIELNFEEFPQEIAKWLKDYAKEKNTVTDNFRIALFFDPFGDLAINGNYFSPEEKSLKAIKELAAGKGIFSRFRAVTVNATHFHHAGATTVQEIAFALAQGNEYMHLLTDENCSADDAAALIGFRFSSGNDFYAEIAKLRAFRMLWSLVVKQYQPEHGCSTNTYIQSETSLFYFSEKDVNSNMLRATAQAMAATIAGCNSLYVHPYNANEEDEFAMRIAGNMQLLLKEESMMHRVADSVGGSYFLEELTQKMAEAAWQLFKEIEKSGGFLEALQKNSIQSKVEHSAEEKKTAFKNGKIVLTGVNKFPNAADKDVKPVDVYSINPANSRLVEPLRLFRLAEMDKE